MFSLFIVLCALNLRCSNTVISMVLLCHSLLTSCTSGSIGVTQKVTIFGLDIPRAPTDYHRRPCTVCRYRRCLYLGGQWLVPLDARERSSCTSNYWDPAFPHLKFNKKRSGPKSPVWRPKADVQFPHLWFSTLNTVGGWSNANVSVTITAPTWPWNMYGYVTLEVGLADVLYSLITNPATIS